MLQVTPSIAIHERELSERFVRASGPGGQNVNKVSTAVELRFDVGASSLPEDVKARLMALAARRTTAEGLLVIDSREHRTQSQNRAEARERLVELVRRAPGDRRRARGPGHRRRPRAAPRSESAARPHQEGTREGAGRGVGGRRDSLVFPPRCRRPRPTRPRRSSAVAARVRSRTIASQLSCAACRLAFPSVRTGSSTSPAAGTTTTFPAPRSFRRKTCEDSRTRAKGRASKASTSRCSNGRRARAGSPRIACACSTPGCGNGESIDVLHRRGFEAWGHDLSALRKWQWLRRERRDRLVVSDGATLPFPEGFFDVVIASGVLEHIGVSEEGGGQYRVRPLPDRDERRRAFLAELVRVVSPDGRLFLDFPNGSFPIDFWHGVTPGGARIHSLREGFLPTVPQIRALCARIDRRLAVSVLSPEGRLRFQQVSSHWYGRLLRAPMTALYRLMSRRPFRFLAATPINPYLVIEVRRRPEALGPA